MKSASWLSNFVRFSCFVSRPETRLRHRRKLLGFRCPRIILITSASVIFCSRLILSNEMLSVHASWIILLINSWLYLCFIVPSFVKINHGLLSRSSKFSTLSNKVKIIINPQIIIKLIFS